MGRGSHLHARARNGHAAHYMKLISQNNCLLWSLVICVFLLGTSSLLRNRSSYVHEDFLSKDIDTFLSELGEQVREAYADAASHMQLRMLRLAAGHQPERPDRPARIFSELLSSIKSLGHTLPCPTTDGQSGGNGLVQKLALNTSGCSNGCFFAINLHNSAEVLPNMFLQLLAVLGSLGGGKDARRSYVSVYESGSTDATPALLTVLRRTLSVLGVPHRIITGGSLVPQGNYETHQLWGSGKGDDHTLGGWRVRRGGPAGNDTNGGGDEDRHASLAAVRNTMLEPLLEPCVLAPLDSSLGAAGTDMRGTDSAEYDGSSTSGDMGMDKRRSHGLGCAPQKPDRVLFLDDVLFCATDVRRLLRYESSDVACGLDFAPASLEQLTPAERQQTMAEHVSAAWGLSHTWANRLSRAWLPYTLWQKVYGRKTSSFGPWSPLALSRNTAVTRDVTGGRLRTRLPLSRDAWVADRLEQGLNTPAYCCWSGVVSLRAEPFLRAPAGGRNSLQSRAVGAKMLGTPATLPGLVAGNSGDAWAAITAQRPPLRFRRRQAGDCGTASERNLVCEDLHSAGYHRVMIDPNIRLVYDWSAALYLYANFDLTTPSNASGQRYQPMSPGDARQVEVSWDDDWVPRIQEGAGAVDCCGTRSALARTEEEGGQGVAGDHNECLPVNLTASWDSARR